MLRLSSAQVVRLEEHLHHYEKYSYYGRKICMEDLVDSILKEVLPPCPPAGNKNESPNVSV